MKSTSGSNWTCPLDKLLLKIYGFYYGIKVKFMSSEAIARSIRKDYHLGERWRRRSDKY